MVKFAYRSLGFKGKDLLKKVRYLCNAIFNLFVLGVLDVLDELDIVGPVSHFEIRRFGQLKVMVVEAEGNRSSFLLPGGEHFCKKMSNNLPLSLKRYPVHPK